tara:strand:+ start:742 stop:1467 length:726 start_codon:yes stop_codon:yes gene_type:complete
VARLETASSIINAAAVEVGLLPDADPFGSQDQGFIQLRALFNSAGRELVTMFPWQVLQRTFSIATEAGDTGSYELPTDYDRLINQTGWNGQANLPVTGPLSPQEWAMMVGRNFGQTTLNVSFMFAENEIVLYPSPPPVGLAIDFLYVSRNWVRETSGMTSDRAVNTDDIALLPPLLLTKLLIVKYKAAKGIDIAVVSREFDMTYMSITGGDKGARVLSASGAVGFPYIGIGNMPFTGFGGV